MMLSSGTMSYHLSFLSYMVGLVSEAKAEGGNESGREKVVLGSPQIESLDSGIVQDRA